MVGGEPTHIADQEAPIVIFDVMCSELIKSTYDNNTELLLISPWVKDYSIPHVWPNFLSNFFEISDMQKMSDIIRKVCENGVDVTLLTKNEEMLKKDWTGVSANKNITESLRFHDLIRSAGCKIVYSQKNHSKKIVSSQSTFITSSNITKTGLGDTQGNAGTYGTKNDFPKYWEDSRKDCLEKIKKG